MRNNWEKWNWEILELRSNFQISKFQISKIIKTIFPNSKISKS
jgi:hypothetical protein